MNKLFILLFVVGISLSSFAGLKSKHLVGEWKYVITLYNGNQDGYFIFSQKNGKLEGVAIQSDSRIPLSKIKINKKNETLCFELPRKDDVSIEFILNVEKNKFKGKGWINEADFDITGEKQK
jgi:hypothetical protein